MEEKPPHFRRCALIYLLIQHDPKIKIVRVIPSSGSIQGAAKTVKRIPDSSEAVWMMPI